jgi:hypothetical protein
MRIRTNNDASEYLKFVDDVAGGFADVVTFIAGGVKDQAQSSLMWNCILQANAITFFF